MNRRYASLTLGLCFTIVSLAGCSREFASEDEIFDRLSYLEYRVEQLEQGAAQPPVDASIQATEESASEDVASGPISEGQKNFESFCTACHKYQREQPMLAPPVFAVSDHYKMAYTNREERIEAIIKFVQTPSEETSVMPGAVQNFKLMPPLMLPDDFLRPIAEYLSDTDFNQPDWYQQHKQQQMQSMGIGMGIGMGRQGQGRGPGAGN